MWPWSLSFASPGWSGICGGYTDDGGYDALVDWPHKSSTCDKVLELFCREPILALQRRAQISQT
jgi:hypothetical protein